MGSDGDEDSHEDIYPKRTEDLSTKSIIEYFKRNIDDIKKNPNIDKFDENLVPIIDRHGDVRLEMLNPPTRNYVLFWLSLRYKVIQERAVL